MASAASNPSGGVERLVSINVNGRVRRVDVLPQETLAHTLRYKLGLTGAKVACNRGECGACTVLIDDVNYYACSTLTHNVKDRAVTTVEGLRAEDGTLHPVQAAFIQELSPACQQSHCSKLIQGQLVRKHARQCQATSVVAGLMITI